MGGQALDINNTVDSFCRMFLLVFVPFISLERYLQFTFIPAIVVVTLELKSLECARPPSDAFK
jgi:hypothetical protein